MAADPTANTRTSFFDEDDLSITFDFTKPDKKHERDLALPSTISNILLRQTIPGAPLQQGYYVLHNQTLAYYKHNITTQPDLVLHLAHARMQPFGPSMTTSNFGFSITRNGSRYEFFSPDEKTIENWTNALRSICVLCNFHEEYKALKMIGKGSFAKVYLVESKTNGKTFAVKAFTKESIVISNKNNAKPSMLNEIDIMRALDHENVIKLYEVYETEKSIYLVLELIQGRSLQELLKKGSFKDNEPRIMNVLSSILEAIAYLATRGVMHRDLKPDNILIDKCDKIKIVDFGLATFIDVPEYIFKKCGTPGYIAPEVFKYDQKNPSTNYDHRCDVFSVGCIQYFMQFGTPFFEGQNASEILKVNRRFTVEFQNLEKVKQEVKNPSGKYSKESMSLMLQLLEFDQHIRPNASQSLSHPYLYSVVHQKLAGLYDVYQSGGSSPTAFDKRASFVQDHFLGQLMSGTHNTTSPNRFTEKDSLYLDVGRPEITGRIDTITSGSANNSVLLASKTISNADSSPVSASAFARSANRNTSLKGYSPVNQGFLKASIYKNMYPGQEGDAPDSGLKLKLEEVKNDRRHSELVGTQSPGYYANINSPAQVQDPYNGELGEVSHENAEKMRLMGQTVNPSKLAESPIKRASAFGYNPKMYEKNV